MPDHRSFAGLDDEYLGLLRSWVADLRREFPSVLHWWAELQATLDVGGTLVSRLHWPAGPASHPRMIALFRMHYFHLHELNVQRAAGPGEVGTTERHWGVRNEDEESEASGPFAPSLLLLDMMEDYAPDLWQHFRLLVFIPVGEDQDLELC